MTLIYLLVPVLLALFILLRSRTNLAAIAALPLLLAFGRSAFIDTYGWVMIVGPVPLTIADVIFGGLGAAWLYIRYRRRSSVPIRFTVEISVMILLAVFILIETTLTWLDGYRLVRVIQITRTYLYLPLGFFVWIDIFRHITESEANDFIGILAALCLPLSILYSASALGVRIYPYPAYLTVYVGQEILVRDFTTIPAFASMALAFYLAQPKRDWRWATATMIIMVGLLLTFTRSIVAGALACIAVALVNEFFKLARRATLIRGVIGAIIIVAVGLGGFIVLEWISPEAFAYLSERLEQVQAGGLEASSLVVRFDMLQGINEALTQTSPVFGAGLVPYDQADPTGMVYRASWILGDIMWASVLLYLGLAGVAVYGLMLVVALWQSFRLGLETATQDVRLGLFLFLFFAQSLALSFTGEGFVTGASVAALPFALLTVARQRAWAVNPVTIPLNQFFSGIHLRWFTQNDEYRWFRLGTLALAMIVIEVWIIQRLVR